MEARGIITISGMDERANPTPLCLGGESLEVIVIPAGMPSMPKNPRAR